MSTRQVDLQGRASDERTHSPQSTAVLLPIGERPLSAVEFQQLASVPAAVEWCANIDNPRTRRAYQHDLDDFCGVVGLTGADEFRSHPRARAGLARSTGNLRPGRGHDPAQTGGVGQTV